MNPKKIIEMARNHDASDIHFIPERKPLLRIDGELQTVDTEPLNGNDTKKLISNILSDSDLKVFQKEGELDTSLGFKGLGRFRVNVLRQKNGIGTVMRVIPQEIPDPAVIGLTENLIEITETPRGLVLCTGPTGSGKTTTLACLLNLINQKRKEHIITIEDPIEYVYPEGESLVRQREVGVQTESFSEALVRAMRQDPDIVLVGELRDLETMSSAITLAETGHLVFSTLHTSSAAETINRIIDVFPSEQQPQVRAQLSTNLEAVIAQQLLQRADGEGRVAAREILFGTNAVGNLIREEKMHQIDNVMQGGSDQGMKTMDNDLLQLVKDDIVTPNEALYASNEPSKFERRLQETTEMTASSGDL